MVGVGVVMAISMMIYQLMLLFFFRAKLGERVDGTGAVSIRTPTTTLVFPTVPPPRTVPHGCSGSHTRGFPRLVPRLIHLPPPPHHHHHTGCPVDLLFPHPCPSPVPTFGLHHTHHTTRSFTTTHTAVYFSPL